MAKVKNPVLFSKHFGVDPALLDAADLIDPFLNVDTQLFIDPVLLEKSSNQRIRVDGIRTFRQHFQNFIRLLAISRSKGDAAWRAAEKLLDLHEPAENGLGYGGSGRSGSSRPDHIRDAMMSTAQEIVELGADDPEMISLMGFFEDEVGPDTISDFTTRVILHDLAKITQDFCEANGIPVSKDDRIEGVLLPRFVDSRSGTMKSTVLVPTDIVRDLPVATDWSDIEAAAFQNTQIRDRVNVFLGNIAKPTVADRKAALRRAAMDSAQSFDQFLATVKEHTSHYDKSLDALGYYKLKWLFGQDPSGLQVPASYALHTGPEELKKLVHDTLSMFKHHVENGNLWEELWVDGKPKKERAAQLIYYALADSFCIANNVDISPEANMGGGPIDFKFSSGYRARVLVEMKRSSGTVRHGYERQLEIYKDASRTQIGIFVVMDFGDVGKKLNQIKAIRNARISAGEDASDIVVIDATPKASASKRK
ncbi:hypothetical protein [Tritonibacter horizontis]|uniref:Uncharacterized protein n=1 Tax=Tritonibacter horizontis TaxID=1768241 RepID=A0A132BWD6_9RHOB|nr:hypothetical protein [Tritonibacter horizontis]KUP92688.1 hypothetical protein TRIHO_24260 [Tritonibacter horizontis]